MAVFEVTIHNIRNGAKQVRYCSTLAMAEAMCKEYKRPHVVTTYVGTFV